MVNTRSGGGQDVLPVICAHIANQQNPTPPPQGLVMDPIMQQFFTAQMQLIQNLTATARICRQAKPVATTRTSTTSTTSQQA
jgi:hypothetical protein